MSNDILAQLANDPYYADAIKLVQSLQQSDTDDAGLDEYLAKKRAERANIKPPTSVIKELGKAGVKGLVGVPELIARAVQGGALDIGQLLGYSPEENVVAQSVGKAAQAIQGVKQTKFLAPNEQFAEEHPIVNFLGENIEGALPWIAGAAASTIPYVGPFILPAAAGLSSQAESTEHQMERGVEGTEALKRSVLPAATTSALFAAMPKFMGVLKGKPTAALEAGFKKGVLPGTLGRPGGVAKGALQGLFAEAPYLYGQGEIKQAVDVATGAMTPEEWAEMHTPEAVAHAIGSSIVGGAGFGALGGIGQKKVVEAKQEEYRNLHKPIVDDKTPIDLNEKPDYKPYIQQDLPIQTAMDLVPGGSAVYKYTDALKLTKQLRDMLVNPIIEHAGFDEAGNRLARVSLPKITPVTQPETEVVPPQPTPTGRRVKRQRNVTSIEAMPIEVPQTPETALEPIIQEKQLDIFAKPETPATKEISKPEDTSRVDKIQYEKEHPDLSLEDEKYLLSNDRVKEDGYGVGTEYETKEPDGDLVTIYRAVPKEGLTGISYGDYVTTSKKYAEDHLKMHTTGQLIENPELVGGGKIISKKVPKNELVVAGANELFWKRPKDTFIDVPADLKEYITDFMTNPDSKVDAVSLSQILGVPEEELISKRQQSLGIVPVEPEATIESPEGEQMPLVEATKRAKELVGKATPETEAERIKKASRTGWKKTQMAEDIVNAIEEDGGIVNKTLGVFTEKALNLYDDIRSDRIDRYIEDTYGILDKAVRDGVLEKRKDGYKTVEGKSIKEWYSGLKKTRENTPQGAREVQKPTIEGEGAPDYDVEITKADKARMAKAEAERAEETARAQRPYTIFKERVDAFDKELNRIDSEIAKLPKSAKKNILRREFTKAKARFKELIKEGNFDKLKKEALPIYEKLSEESAKIKKYYEIQKGVDPELAQEHLDKAIKDFKKSNTYKQFEAILDDLKSQARNIGRLELGEKLNEFRENVEKQKKSKDLTGIERVETAEEQRLKEEQKSIKTKEETLTHTEDMKFLDEMSSKRVSDEERIENADEILDMAEEFFPNIRKEYAKQKSNKQKSLNLKKIASDTWSKKNVAIHSRGLAAVEQPRKVVQAEEDHGARTTKTAKELEREQNPELKAAYEKQQENLRKLKEKQEAKVPERAEAKARREEEERLRRDLELKKESKAKALQEEKRELAKKLSGEEKPVEFNIKFNKKGEVVSKAEKDYSKFLESKKTVGATSSIPKAAHAFVSHLADKFKLDKMFIVTESDIKNSNIKDTSLTAKEIYDDNGDYVGMLRSTTDGVDFLSLNDKYIKNEKQLVNTISHEVGHAIINKHFESASAETKQAIQNDFNSWLDKISQKDSKAINELYQESGKTWEDFKEDYKDYITKELASGEFEVYGELIFHEYLAEQVAKYIKVTESAPNGILARFFNTLAEKLRYVMRFANREFAKNHAPIQSVAKWLNGLKKQEEITTKKNSNLKKKTKVTYDDIKRIAKQVHDTFDPTKNSNLAKNMTDLIGANLADKGVVKQGWLGMARLPWWREEVRPAAENFEKSLETANLLKKFIKATADRDQNIPNIVSLKSIEKSYNAMSKTSRELLNKLLVEGDKEEIEWESPKDIKSETLKNISKEDFEVYKQIRKFTDQAWQRDLQNQSDTLAYSLTTNKELQDKLSIAIRLKEIDSREKLKDFLESQPSIITKGGLKTLITPQEFEVIADSIYESGGMKDFYSEYSRNYSTKSLTGYIPRERLDGAEWLVELNRKDGTKIYSRGFYTKAEAQRFFEDFKKNPEKYLPKGIERIKEFKGKYPTLGSENFESLLDEPVIRPISDFDRFNKGEDELIANNVASVLNKVGDIPNKEDIISAVRKEIMKHILAQRGMQNRVRRSETLIEGYNEDSPLDAIQSALDRSAYRQARLRYIIDQSRLISNTKDVQKKNMIREYVNKTLEPSVTGSKQVQMFKNLTAIYFMGFRPLTALLQLGQLHTVGAAELGMHLKKEGVSGTAQGLLAKAELDVRLGKLSSVEKEVLSAAEDMGVTWETSSQSAMFESVDAATANHFLGKRILKATDIALRMFKYMEHHNRQSAILAAYRIFSKGSEIFNQEAFDRAIEYNNNTNFMMNKGNVPYWAMKNPLGMSAYTLMSYTLNMANWMLNRFHGSLSDTGIDKWTQREAFFKMMGYTAVLAGASGLPFSDDLNKLIRKIFGRDLHLETKQFIKKNANEDIANLVADGIFTPLNMNISSNIAVRIPFFSGLLDDKSVGESVSGAAGAMVSRILTAGEAAYNLQGRKFVENISPEVLAGALRAERLYREGQRGPSGKPIYFKGRPIKLTGPEAVMQGVFGIKSERRANIMHTTDAEYKLTEYWRNKRKIAESKARKGDKTALQDFNRQLLKDKNARMLVKPLKLTENKLNEERTAFELAQ